MTVDERILKFTADRIYNPEAGVSRADVERSIRDEIVRAIRAADYYLLMAVEIREVPNIIPSNPEEPLPTGLIALRGEALAHTREKQ